MSNRTKPARGGRGSAAPTTPALRRLAPIVLALLIGGLTGGLLGAALTDDSSPTADRVAELRAAEARRDAQQIVELTGQARRTREDLLPVLDGLAAAAPAGATTAGPAADPAAVRGWQTTTSRAVADFADPPSGGTAVNIARSGLSAALRELDLAVGTYAAALAVPDANRPVLQALAGRQRDAAVATWSVAATQLDVLNVDAGHGHAHVFLPAVPGQGALTADGSHEGE
ncbi:hypothetical protein [Micromonospora sp. NPDC049679]|uniref:hypothetical protein n=1 Tax=Micromonospora sp. NPDC049679 TaxID=3155920 RepID=UPI0033E960CE